MQLEEIILDLFTSHERMLCLLEACWCHVCPACARMACPPWPVLPGIPLLASISRYLGEQLLSMWLALATTSHSELPTLRRFNCSCGCLFL